MIRIRCYEVTKPVCEEVRRAAQRCANCLKAKNQVPKLLTCSACKVARYCSADCQRTHWPAHRVQCRIDIERRKQAETVDYRLLSQLDADPLSQLPGKPPVDAPALHEALEAELRAFAHKFMPALLEAGCHALRPRTGPGPGTVLFALLERLPERQCGASTQPWARFRITFVGAMPLEHLADFFGNDDIVRVVQRAKARVSGEAVSALLATVCSATTPAKPVTHVEAVPLVRVGAGVLEVRDGESWQERFKGFVQRTCGHPPSVPCSPAMRSLSDEGFAGRRIW